MSTSSLTGERRSFASYFNRYRKTLGEDAIAGLTGAIAGAPQAMGFAIIAGINPIYGLYTAVVATIIGTLTAGSSMMTIAPTNALALVVGGALGRYTGEAQIERLFTLTLLVGLLQLLFGVLRLGNLTRFVSNAVMTGFITGAGLLIMLGQIRHVNGHVYTVTGSPLVRFWDWLTHVPNSQWQTVIVGAVAMAIIVTLKRTRLKNFGILIALVTATLIVRFAGWQNVAIVRDISAVPSGLPAFHLPQIGFAMELWNPALALAVLALVQSAALTQSIPEPDGSTPSTSRDFIGQGLANIAGSLFQNMPSGGSLSRTAVNISAGAQTRMANIFAGVFIGIILIVLGKTIELIPMAALAGQLIVAAASLIRLDVIKTVWRVSPGGRISMLITFISTLLLPLEYSIYIGVALSLGIYVYTSAGNVRAVQLIPLGNHQFKETAVPEKLPSREPTIIYVSGHMFFAAVHYLENLLPDLDGVQRPMVILRIRDNQYLGSTGLRALNKYATELAAHGGKLILTGVSPEIKEQLERTRTVQEFGPENIFYADDVVFSATERALAYAQEWLEHQEKSKETP